MLPHPSPLELPTHTKTSDGLLQLGTNICGILHVLGTPNQNLDVCTIVKTLEDSISQIYHQNGVFYDPVFIQTDYCKAIEQEIGIERKGPLTPCEYVLSQQLFQKEYPVGATILIIMKMRHKKVLVGGDFEARAMKALRGVA